MIRRLAIQFVVLALGALITHSALAQSKTFRLADGSLLSGVPVSYNEKGVVVRLPGDTYSRRVGWTNFTEEALMVLVTMPQAAKYVQPLLSPPEDEEDDIVLEIKPKHVDRLSRPDPEAGMSTLFASSVSLSLFALMYLASIYAGFEISIFRNLPPVAGLATGALLPFLGPAILVCLPTRVQFVHDPNVLTQEEIAAAQQEEEVPVAEIAPEPEPVQEEVTPSKPAPTVYKRGLTSFNRRFFETKFAGFLRVVPGEAEKDMEMFFISARGEHVSKRLTKVAQTELTLQIAKGDATADVVIPYTDIREIHVRHMEDTPS